MQEQGLIEEILHLCLIALRFDNAHTKTSFDEGKITVVFDGTALIMHTQKQVLIKGRINYL